jgi:hypothetical protein
VRCERRKPLRERRGGSFLQLDFKHQLACDINVLKEQAGAVAVAPAAVAVAVADEEDPLCALRE